MFHIKESHKLMAYGAALGIAGLAVIKGVYATFSSKVAGMQGVAGKTKPEEKK